MTLRAGEGEGGKEKYMKDKSFFLLFKKQANKQTKKGKTL